MELENIFGTIDDVGLKKLRGWEETSTVSDSTHHKVFENIRDDEYEHIVTMKAGCQIASICREFKEHWLYF